MAIHPSAKKRHRQNIELRERNRQLRSEFRGTMKSVRQAIGAGETSVTADQLKRAQSMIDRMVAKGIIHRNGAARYKSRLTRAAGRSSQAA